MVLRQRMVGPEAGRELARPRLLPRSLPRPERARLLDCVKPRRVDLKELLPELVRELPAKVKELPDHLLAHLEVEVRKRKPV